jgi:outer membrane protein assembly complex protein YaeT
MKATDCLAWLLRRPAAALLAVLLLGTVSLAQTETNKVIVEDVICQGNRIVPTQEIISQIKTRPSTEYKEEVVQEDLRRLLATNKFTKDSRVDKVAVGSNKVRVYFLMVEYPSTVQEIIYHGAEHISSEELDTLTQLRKGMLLNPVANRLACQAIQRHYQEKGRIWAAVELAEGSKVGDTRVVFNITEGPVAKIQSIDFSGNTFVSAARLRVQIDSGSTFLGLGGTYEPDRINHDVAKLEEYYKNFGFQDVKVSRELKWDEGDRRVRLIFHIHEGVRYRVTAVKVVGNTLFGQDELLAPLVMKPGEYFQKNKVDADTQIIQAKYGYTGHQVVVKDEEFSPGGPDQPGQVELHYQVLEKPPARVGSIIIVGNDVTRQNVILRQIPLYPGQILTYPDLRLAENKLRQLHIFEDDPQKGIRPTLSVVDPENDSEYKDILVQVQEAPTGSIMFGVGVNSDAGLTGSVAINERNFDITRFPTSFEDLFSGHAFRGAGQEFRVEIVPGTQVQRYQVNWREPYLFDSPYSLGVSLYYWDRVYNDYNESRLGTRFTVGRRLNDKWSAAVTLRLEDVGIHDVPYYEPIDFQQIVGQHFLAGARLGVTRDTSDSILRPTQGSRFEAAFEQVFGDYSFPQAVLDFTKYFTVYERADGSGRHVLAAHSQIGWSGDSTPLFERFYAGGYRSMRGFEFRGVGPVDNTFHTYQVGGDFQFLNSLEYQIPILADDHLYAVTFVDTGTVESSVEIRNYRVAVGAGLRIVVPMLGPVPIALDFGFPIVKGPYDKEQVFSFWVGFFH